MAGSGAAKKRKCADGPDVHSLPSALPQKRFKGTFVCGGNTAVPREMGFPPLGRGVGEGMVGGGTLGIPWVGGS